MRVLVVDDSELNLEIASEALGQLGVEAATAASGVEQSTGHFQPFDLVLMDGSMPEHGRFHRDATHPRTGSRAWPGRRTRISP